MAVIFESQEQLDNHLHIWQKELRLMDWDVTATITPSYEMDMKDTHACIDWFMNEKSATIQILNAAQYPPGFAQEPDHEVSLVHELLHLHYAPFEKTEAGSLEHQMMEYSIDVLSKALVRLRRKGVETRDTVRSTTNV